MRRLDPRRIPATGTMPAFVRRWLVALGTGTRRRPRRRSRVREMRPQASRALRLLRATSRLGVPGSMPAPPELIPAGARVLAQGYLNRFSMPLLDGWLLPRWMREQSDPASPLFTPRSVANIMVNQTARNWTALGIPGRDHPVESLVDPRGMLTPVPGGPSLDLWVDIDGSSAGRMEASRYDVTQRLQGAGPGGVLPVVLSAYEANGLRVSRESWLLPLPEGDWAATQVVLFNIADLPLTGTFYFALRPYNPEGISPIYDIGHENGTLLVRGRPALITWPQPDGWALSTLREGDLFSILDFGFWILDSDGTAGNPKSKIQNPKSTDPHGFAHGVLAYRFNIEPWEEAEFLAFMPVHARAHRRRPRNAQKRLFRAPRIAMGSPDPGFYSRAKAATTLEWRSVLDGGMSVSFPRRDLQLSWEANRAHLLALHDGDEITPGPDLYHSLWLRDAAYMAYALSACGYVDGARQLVRGFLKRQRREGAFVSHLGEWDSTGQVLWTAARHLKLHPDDALAAEVLPSLERGVDWILRALAQSPDGLLPPGISSEHLGPPDRYYWDNLWTLAGLEAMGELMGSPDAARAAAGLRETLLSKWQDDAERLGQLAVPAAPGRGIDIGMVGSLAAWYPLGLFAPDERLEATLQALERCAFYEGALFVAGHSGWASYLNMRVAGCRLAQGSPRGWEMMQWLLRHASPTYNWPEAIHPRSGGGSAGDGHHGWASAEWLLLVRSLLFREEQDALLVTPVLPEEWLATPGEIDVKRAPTVFGPLSYTLTWDTGGRELTLSLDPAWRSAPREIRWRVPGKLEHALVDGARASTGKGQLSLPPDARRLEVLRHV